MSDIVERLRERKEPTIEVDMHYPQIVCNDVPDDECIEAADEIERLRAEVEKLRAALDILQAAMTAKKPIPLALKKAIIEARAAITKGEREG